MVGVIFSSRIFFIFPKKVCEEKVYRNISYILYFSKKKKKNKKISLFIHRLCGNR